MRQPVPSPQIPVHAGGGDLWGKLSDLGVWLHHAALRGDAAGAQAWYVPQQALQALGLASLAELSPPRGRNTADGSSGDTQEGVSGESFFGDLPPPLTPPIPDFTPSQLQSAQQLSPAPPSSAPAWVGAATAP